ncbi:dTMP kinase [Caldibacillus thermolactis]|uniref:Thymidylate kinase n=1 Tax=Pallidibacillus thermolactis TaxID=251051 RepID=A0ABT2WF50_9BACI|nr:dTMP kinase [Pallidibacillus thermolactis]MCU9594308.1 dTMP kinase [Pallidibacillus thermolactis]MCU9601589.1 dTMP kinase [Pallidibacillus thermolactis subsp. kokeshiiformis]MED1672538.1 dTMP kinase [Pallidibacillus thermolactis subsp. kokeshiiformis]
MGYFFSLEGCEGAGKSTVLKLLADTLKQKGFRVVTTREPGGIEIAEQIRNVILDRNNVKMDEKTEALLYAAARRQHLVEKIIPELDKGSIVLCDRFVDSSLTYQGYARGIGINEVLTINKFAIEDYMPDLTIYLDVPPEVGLARINKDKNREVNRLDVESLQFHAKVREGYHLLLKQYPDRILMINAQNDIDIVHREVLNKILQFINAR